MYFEWGFFFSMASMILRYFSLIYKSASLQVNFMKQLNCGRNNYILHTADRNNCGTDYSEVRCLQTIRRGGADPAFFVRGGYIADCFIIYSVDSLVFKSVLI